MEIVKIKEKPWIYLLFGLSFFFLVMARLFPGSPAHGQFAVVSVQGKEIERIPLNDSEEGVLHTFSFEFGGEIYEGTLEMQEGRVRLQRLPRDISPLSIHADTGWISQSYQLIVCLPVGLLVRIEGPPGDQSQYQVDVVSGPGRMLPQPGPAIE